MKTKNYYEWSLDELIKEQNYLKRLVSTSDELPRSKTALHAIDLLISNKKRTLNNK